MKKSDFVIIGAGIIGLSIARELRARFPKASIAIFEKETGCGQHASGRNSGVLHAGFYYSPESLKAKFTQEGNRAMTEYCRSKGIPVLQCGKLVVAQNEKEVPVLEKLFERGEKNGVSLEMISEKEAARLEPRARTVEKAIFSPTTSSIDPARVMESLSQDAAKEGIAIYFGARYLGRDNGNILTTMGSWSAGHLINCAGLYADCVARDFGFSKNYRILPFRGLYLYSTEPPGSLKMHVYPVPDLRNPFLGVHVTVMADGRLKLGPTAIPALWREHYEGMKGFKPGEFAEIVARQAGLLAFSNFDFKRLAWQEVKKQFRSVMAAQAGRLLRGVKVENYRNWGKPGVRAQLFDLTKRELVMDFVIEGDAQSTHVLNAVSPGFTCAIPFARHVCDLIEKPASLV